MGLSKRYLDTNDAPFPVDVDRLGRELDLRLPEAVFGYLLGSSAVSGVVGPHSDLDLAFYLNERANVRLYDDILEVCRSVVGPVRADIGFLNAAEAVYRFEALRGRLLFCRDEELWLGFYSRTSREYEHQLYRYEAQRRYRLGATG